MTDAIDITTEQRKLLLALLRRFIPGVAVWAFGSRVKWTARPNSDLDLVVFTAPKQKPLVSELKDAIAESNIPFMVDLHVWDEIPERFHDIIRKEYVELKEAEGKQEGLKITGKSWPTVNLESISATDKRSFAMGPFGSNIKSENYKLSGVPVLRGVNFTANGFSAKDLVFLSEEKADELVASQAYPDDLVFVAQGTVGKLGLVPDEPRFQKTVLSQNLMKFACDRTKAHPRFLYYFFISNEGQQVILSRANTTGVPCISRPLSSLKLFEVPLPSLSEQCAIASVLGALDDKIESNRRTSQILERVARAIFRAWFMDFEPVKAKAAGAFSFPGMTKEAFDALPTRLVESELGSVPEGWNVLPLDEVMEVNPSRRLPKGVPSPYLEMSQMPTDGHSPVSWTEREAGSGARFMNGDTLVARITPCLENGKTAFVDFLNNGQVAWGSTEYIVLRPKPPTPNLYAYLLARTPEFRAFAIQHMTGSSGRQRVPFSIMSKFNIVIGSAPVMKAFGEVVEPLFLRSSSSVSESRVLSSLRNYLLPKLLNGEISAEEN